MIKSEQQKNRTLKMIEDYNNQLNTLDEYSRGSLLSLIGTLEQEVEEYEKLKKGIYELPQNITFVELLQSISKIRISKGLSQQDLANMLGITKQQLNRYEEHNYQNISIAKINEILEVLNISVSLFQKVA